MVACPDVSPAPQIAANPNPAVAGSAVTFTATGFDPKAPLFIAIDAVGDCTNPTQGTVVYSSATHADPVTTDAITLPAPLTTGDYLLRACTHSIGSEPSNCVQVAFTVTDAPTPSPSASPSTSASPT